MQIEISQILRYSRKLLAAVSINQIKPIIEQAIKKYDLKDKDLNSTFLKIRNQIISYIPSVSNEFRWYVLHFLRTPQSIIDFLNKSGDDYEALDVLKQYFNLNKNKKKNFVLNDSTTLDDLKQFVNQYNQQLAFKHFTQPKNAEKIFIPPCKNYKIFKCNANNKYIQQQLNDITTINIDENGNKQYYTCWCVVNGTKPWGYLTQSPWNYYYYITTNDNKPYILMNFGDYGQVNNIHDRTFSNWNDELLNIVHYLMNKDGFNPKQNMENGIIFNTKFNQLDYMQKIYNNQINLDDLIKIISYNEYNLYYDQLNDKNIISHGNSIVFFYDSDNLHRVGNEKFNINILKILISNNQIELCSQLLEDKYIQPQDKYLYDECVKFVCSNPQLFIALLKNKQIKLSDQLIISILDIIKNKATQQQKQTIKQLIL